MFHCAKVYIKLLLFYIQENYGCMQKDVLMDSSMFFSGKTNFTAFEAWGNSVYGAAESYTGSATARLTDSLCTCMYIKPQKKYTFNLRSTKYCPTFG